MASCAIVSACTPEQLETTESNYDVAGNEPSDQSSPSFPASNPDAGTVAVEPPIATSPVIRQPEGAGTSSATAISATQSAPLPVAEPFQVCRTTAVDGCESIYVSHWSAELELCTTLEIDDCPTYSRQGLVGVDVPFAWRLNSVRAYRRAIPSAEEPCRGPAPLSAKRADSVLGEISWDEEATDSVPEQVDVRLVASFTALGLVAQMEQTIELRSRQPLSTETGCENGS